MLQATTLQFLTDLAANNHRDWFAEHRATYEVARADFLAFCTQLIARIGEFDPLIAAQQAKDCVFRINRDTRFSKDKSPYKSNMGIWLTAKGKKSNDAGYYLHVEPSADTFLAGGMYMPPNDELKKVRQEIDYHSSEFNAIITHPDFVRHFGSLSGSKLKKAPKGYNPDHPDIEWLKHTDFLAYQPFPAAVLTRPESVDLLAVSFRTMKPLNDFLNRAISL